MIAKSGSIGYLHEPFNPDYGICGSLFPQWYTTIHPQNQSKYISALKAYLSFQFPLKHHFRALVSKNTMIRDLKYWQHLRTLDPSIHRPLLKDPIALFSAKWLQRQFDMQVIVMIRNPLAFAGSLKKAQWAFDFRNLAQQPVLESILPGSLWDDVVAAATRKPSLMDQSILLWNVIHTVILNYQQEQTSKESADETSGQWLFLKHETLSENPVVGFEQIFQFLDLEVTDDIRDAISEYSNAAQTQRHGEIRRDSKANISSWKTRLTPAEADKIRSETAEISEKLYHQTEIQAYFF